MLSRLRSRGFRGLGATAVAVAALSLGGAALAPAAGSVPSNLRLLDAGVDGGFYKSAGEVKAGQRVCLADREVKFLVKRPGGTDLLDVARSSDNGGWTSVVPEADYIDGGVNGTLYKLVPRKIKKGARTTKCGGDKVAPS